MDLHYVWSYDIYMTNIFLENPWKGDFKKPKKFFNDTTHFLSHPRTWQTWKFIKYGHVMCRRKAHGKEILIYPNWFLPHPKFGPWLKMTQNDSKPKNVPSYNFWWSVMFSDMLYQQRWRMKLRPVQWARCYLNIK